MALFFHSTYNDDQAVAELRHYLSVNAQFPYKHLLPDINEVESTLIVDLVGQATYDRIAAAYLAGPTIAGDNGVLHKKMQLVIAKLAMANFVPFNEVQFDADGVSTLGKGDNRTSAYDYQVQRIIATLARSGNNAIEALLTYLESKPLVFTEYAASTAKVKNQEGLVNNAAEFSNFYYIGNSYLTFRALRSTYLNVETDMLKPIIGDDLYTEIAIPTLNHPVKLRLLRTAKKACVFQTVAEALELQLPFEINADGLRVHYTAQYGNVRYFMPPSMAQVEAVRLAALRKANECWTEISNILTELNPPETPVIYSPIVGEEKFIAL